MPFSQSGMPLRASACVLCMCVHTSVCVCLHVYVCVVCVYLCLCVYPCVYICVRAHVCVLGQGLMEDSGSGLVAS